MGIFATNVMKRYVAYLLIEQNILGTNSEIRKSLQGIKECMERNINRPLCIIYQQEEQLGQIIGNHKDNKQHKSLKQNRTEKEMGISQHKTKKNMIVVYNKSRSN
jgi:hypothetical protein